MFDKAKQLIKNYQSFILFCIVGAINTVIDFLVFTLLTELNVAGVELCQAISYTAGIISSFVLNRLVTFRKSSTTSLITQIFTFVAVNAVSLVAGMWLIKLAMRLGLGKYLSKLIVTALVAIINYLGYKVIVFGVGRKKK